MPPPAYPFTLPPVELLAMARRGERVGAEVSRGERAPVLASTWRPQTPAQAVIPAQAGIRSLTSSPNPRPSLTVEVQATDSANFTVERAGQHGD